MWKYNDVRRGVTIEYGLTENENYLGELSYGIEARMYTGSTVIDSAVVEDAFCTCFEAKSFIMLLAENGVEPCHLKDVVIDSLSR